MGFVERAGVGRTRSLRIDEAFNTELESEAEKKNVSVNNLMERIIEDYINHGRWIDGRKAMIIMPSIMRNILDALDDDTIKSLGTAMGSSIPLEGFLMRGLHNSEKKAELLILRILGEHDNWFSASYHHHSRAYFYIRSNMGDKWILFVEAYLSAFFRECVGIEAEYKRDGENLQILI